MVQPFLDAIGIEGEWSLVFFAGEFSHAVLKRPAPGDFRVQDEHGGTAAPGRPPAGVIESARRALEAVSEPWIYARVDGCAPGGVFQLLELEMLEPTLYLDTGPEPAGHFARTIVAALSRQTRTTH